MHELPAYGVLGNSGPSPILTGASVRYHRGRNHQVPLVSLVSRPPLCRRTQAGSRLTASLAAPDAYYRPTLGAARQERVEGIRQVIEVDGSRDLVQVPRMEIAALCESAPQLAPRLDLKPVGIYTEEVYAP